MRTRLRCCRATCACAQMRRQMLSTHLQRCCSECKRAAGIEFVMTLQIKFDAFTLSLPGQCFPLHLLLQPIEPVLGHTCNASILDADSFSMRHYCTLPAETMATLLACQLAGMPGSCACMALAARLMSRLVRLTMQCASRSCMMQLRGVQSALRCSQWNQMCPNECVA